MRNNHKKLSLLTAVVSFAVVLSSCNVPVIGNKNDDSSNTEQASTDSGLKVQAKQSTIGKIMSPDEMQPEEIKSELFDIPVNISDTAEFNILNIAGEDVNIYWLNASNAPMALGLGYDGEKHITEQNEYITFLGNGYNKQSRDEEGNPNPYSTLYLEFVTEQDHSIPVSNISESGYSENECVVKGVMATSKSTQDGYKIIFYGNIVIGDSKTDIQQKISSGTQIADNVYAYRNKMSTFIVDYDEADKAEKIIVLNNEPET